MKPQLSGIDGDRESGKRRSKRLCIAMPVTVRGKNGGALFEEAVSTATVSAHGCMVYLATEVIKGQQISIVNPHTGEELPCTAIFLGKREAGKMEVALEFDEPSPLFWRINFPPEDWDPDERKRPGASVQSPFQAKNTPAKKDR
jgi:hypothetical protein